MPRDHIVLLTLFICCLLAVESLIIPSIPKLLVGYVGQYQETSTFLFVGDVMLARHVETLIEQHGPEYPFVGLSALRHRYDAVIGNFEAPIPRVHKQTEPYQLDFSVASTSITSLDRYFDHVSLANNHTYDHGQAGLDETREKLSQIGVTPFGDPLTEDPERVTFLAHGDEQIAVVGINATNPISTTTIADLFVDLRDHSSMQIAYVHWGIEYDLMHSPEQSDLARLLIDHGADAVIGHHPHVIQDIGVYNGAPIFYSLGNFIFDQYFSDDVQVGLGVELALTDNDVTYRLIPFTSQTHNASPRLMAYEEKMRLLADIKARSAPELALYLSEDGVLSITQSLASL